MFVCRAIKSKPEQRLKRIKVKNGITTTSLDSDKDRCRSKR